MSDGGEYERHELSAMFPDMTPDAYAGLVRSVREHGAMKPVVLCDDKVLDGWHRYKAYKEAGVPFDVADWDGEYGSPLKFAIAENLDRRDLTPSQRAALAVEVKRRIEAETLPLVGGDRMPGRGVDHFGNNSKMVQPRHARDEAAEALRVNSHYVNDAERIQDASPETFAEVKAGTKTIPQAKRELGLAKPKPKPEPKPEPDDDPWADVEPEPEPEPNCVVNGVPGYDADVARLKAAGRIPAGVTATVEDPGGDVGGFAAALEAAEEEQVERAAKVDDLSDEEWLATLPLSSELDGVSLKRFRIEAVTFRRMESTRRAVRRALNDAERAAGKPSSWSGKVHAMWSWPLRMSHPSQWRKCSPPEKGGCDGTGVVPVIGGQCGACEGGGYVVR